MPTDAKAMTTTKNALTRRLSFCRKRIMERPAQLFRRGAWKWPRTLGLVGWHRQATAQCSPDAILCNYRRERALERDGAAHVRAIHREGAAGYFLCAL